MTRHSLPLVAVLVLLLAGCNRAATVAPQNFLEITTCLSLQAEERQLCFNDFIERYAKSGKTTREMLADLEHARGESAQVESECHPMVHAIGRWTYKTKGNIGDSFEACDQTCHSGCFHGVMERMFYSDEQIAKGIRHLSFVDMERVIPGICDRDKFSKPSTQVIFQCLHGLGHAVLFTLGYDLELALKTCDLLATSYEQSSCYGGVMMENVTAFDPKLRDVDPSDPLYPCSKLEGKYRSACFSMQTSLMIEYGLSEQQMGETCLKAGDYSHDCFVSLGRDYSNYVRMNSTQRATDACQIHSTGFEESCINGVIYALIDNTWNGKYAYIYCNTLRGDLRALCYRNANSYLGWSYEFKPEQVTRGCHEFAGENVALCLENLSS